jgi:hypothetical protein
MNILKQDRRRSRVRKAHLEFLDDRIVPSTVQPAAAVAVEVAQAGASVNSLQQSDESAGAESKIEIKHENHVIKMEERREANLERREARLEKLAARRAAAHHFSPAVVVETPAAQAAAILAASKAGQSTSAPSQASGSSSSAGSTTMSPGSTMPTTPVTTPVTTSPGTGSTTGISSGSGSTSTNPLPANVSVLLGTVYEEYENGDLPTTTQPGQVEIQGTTVGVQIRSSSADFNTVVADAESLGLQVTTVSDAYDMVVGYLPIAQLPAAAQLAGAPSITPVLDPTLN